MVPYVRSFLKWSAGMTIASFIGRSLYLLWHYHRYPMNYAIQSAPWYTAVLTSLGFTVVICLLAWVLDVFLKRWERITWIDKEAVHGKD